MPTRQNKKLKYIIHSETMQKTHIQRQIEIQIEHEVSGQLSGPPRSNTFCSAQQTPGYIGRRRKICFGHSTKVTMLVY